MRYTSNGTDGTQPKELQVGKVCPETIKPNPDSSTRKLMLLIPLRLHTHVLVCQAGTTNGCLLLRYVLVVGWDVGDGVILLSPSHQH